MSSSNKTNKKNIKYNISDNTSDENTAIVTSDDNYNSTKYLFNNKPNILKNRKIVKKSNDNDKINYKIIFSYHNDNDDNNILPPDLLIVCHKEKPEICIFKNINNIKKQINNNHEYKEYLELHNNEQKIEEQYVSNYVKEKPTYKYIVKQFLINLFTFLLLICISIFINYNF